MIWLKKKNMFIFQMTLSVIDMTKGSVSMGISNIENSFNEYFSGVEKMYDDMSRKRTINEVVCLHQGLYW